MNRRAFIAGLGCAAAWPVLGRAQRSSMPVIGWLSVASAETFAPYVTAFRQGLADVGFAEGQNVTVDYRWANGDRNRLPGLAAELVARNVNVIIGAGGSTLAAKNAAKTIPVVGLTGFDPVKSGLVDSLGRPGGNITGVAILATSLGLKRFEALRELVPDAKLFAMLVNPQASPTEAQEVKDAAGAAGRELLVLAAESDDEVEASFRTFAQLGAGALLVMGDPFFDSSRDRLVALAAENALPAVYPAREFALAGGLMSYGSDVRDANRQLGIYAGKILRGAKPSDLPFQQSVQVELILNAKTAKALGLTFPLNLIGRADEVIE